MQLDRWTWYLISANLDLDLDADWCSRSVDTWRHGEEQQREPDDEDEHEQYHSTESILGQSSSRQTSWCWQGLHHTHTYAYLRPSEVTVFYEHCEDGLMRTALTISHFSLIKRTNKSPCEDSRHTASLSGHLHVFVSNWGQWVPLHPCQDIYMCLYPSEDRKK